MRVAVASGKGGAGKTTVAVGLALTAPGPVRLLDCDVEEPNAHLFTAPSLSGSRRVTVPVPEVDRDRCDGCGDCSAACAFNALACMGGPPLVFPELCHGCGACALVCPRAAIREAQREIGTVEWGTLAAGAGFGHGRLDLGEASAPPVIDAVRRLAEEDETTILDCPPGTACPFVASVRGVDVVLLVAEPTPFGLSDLQMAVEAVRALGLRFGVLVNRDGVGDDRVDRYCHEEAIPILARIADDRRIAAASARGIPPVTTVDSLRPVFEHLHDALARLVSAGPAPAATAAQPSPASKEVPG